MKAMRPKSFEIVSIVILVFVCIGACVLVNYLPLNALDTGIVYQGF